MIYNQLSQKAYALEIQKKQILIYMHIIWRCKASKMTKSIYIKALVCKYEMLIFENNSFSENTFQNWAN